MNEINSKVPDGGDDSLPPRIVDIIEELLNPTYFAANDGYVDFEKAKARVAAILNQYRQEILTDPETQVSRIRPKDGGLFISTAISERSAERKITFCPEVFKVPTEIVERDLVAVMMPFAQSFNSVHAAIIAACKGSNLRSTRADNIWDDSTVIQDIFKLIFISRIVVADFTEKNPNVLYETGIAHTLGKVVIPIAQSKDDVPFDLRHHRYLTYLPNKEGMEALQAELTKRLLTIVKSG